MSFRQAQNDELIEEQATLVRQLISKVEALRAVFKVGTGDPNGAVVGNIGTAYLRQDGGAGSTLYVKESGIGTSSGWVAK